MPLSSTAPLKASDGRPSSFKPRVSTTPDRCEPDECADT